MDIQTLTAVFKWCTIINVALLVLTIILLISAPDYIYSMHSELFPISREAFDLTIYGFIGLYKIAFVTFNLVPYLALLIVGKKTV